MRRTLGRGTLVGMLCGSRRWSLGFLRLQGRSSRLRPPVRRHCPSPPVAPTCSPSLLVVLLFLFRTAGGSGLSVMGGLPPVLMLPHTVSMALWAHSRMGGSGRMAATDVPSLSAARSAQHIQDAQRAGLLCRTADWKPNPPSRTGTKSARVWVSVASVNPHSSLAVSARSASSCSATCLGTPLVRITQVASDALATRKGRTRCGLPGRPCSAAAVSPLGPFCS